MSIVNAETGELVQPEHDGFPPFRLADQPMDREQAQQITTAIKARATRLCQMVKEAHDGKAWAPLGYATWAEYVGAEFDMSRSRSYQLIGHALALESLADAAGLPAMSTMVDTPERAIRAIDVPAATDAIREAVADLPGDAPDEARVEVVDKVVAEHRTTTTSAPEPEAEEPPAATHPPPPPAPVVDPTLARRAAASNALVRAADLFRLDPVQIATDAHPDDRDDWSHFAAEVQEWGARLAVQFATSNRLRSVQ